MNNSTINAQRMLKHEQQFLNWVKEHPNHEWEYNWEISEILKEFPDVDSMAGLIQVVYDDGWFDREYFLQIMLTWDYYWSNIAV